MSRFFLPEGYMENPEPLYFHDTDDVTWQPDVYKLAGELAVSRSCESIIDIGCGSARKSLDLGLEVIGIDSGPNLPSSRQGAVFIEHDLETGLGVLEYLNGVVVCADVVEHLRDPLPLLSGLRSLADRSPALLISTPDRDLVRGPDDLGPPRNPCHVREWNKREFAQLLGSVGIQAEITHTIDNDRDRSPTTLLAVALRAA